MDHQPSVDDASFAALGRADWRERRSAVDRLTTAQDADLPQLIGILRESHRDLSRLNAAIQILAGTSLDVVPHLIPLLNEPDRELRCYVALTLGERGDRQAVSALVELLDDADENVKTHAVDALGRIQSIDAVDPLLRLLDRRDFATSFAALQALASIGDRRVTSHVVPLLGDLLLQAPAFEALGRIGDESTIALLLKVLRSAGAPVLEVARSLANLQRRDELRFGQASRVAALIRDAVDAEVVAAVLSAVVDAGDSELADVVTLLGVLPGKNVDEFLARLLLRPVLRPAALAALQRRDAAAVPCILDALRFGDDETQAAGIELVGRLGGAAAAEKVIPWLDAEEHEVVTAAVRTLGQIGHLAAAKHLVPLAGHENKSVRYAVAQSLASLATRTEVLGLFESGSAVARIVAVHVAVHVAAAGDKSTFLDELITAAGDDDARVRFAAVESLAGVDDERANPVLVKAAESDVSTVRTAALAALASNGVEQARSLLAATLDDSDPWVRYFVLRALLDHYADDVGTPRLTQTALHDESVPVQILAVGELARRGAAWPAIAPLVDSPEVDLAVAATEALGSAPSSEGRSLLVRAMSEGAMPRRVRAVLTLARIQGDDAIEPLRTATTSAMPQLSSAAIDGLCHIGTAAAVVALLELSCNPKVREACLAALCDCGRRQIQLLAQGLHHSDADVRRNAVETLTRMQTAQAVELLKIAANDRHASIRFAAHAGLDRSAVILASLPTQQEGAP